ncbi:exonuclease III [Tubulinosema ratisbonensis]|uniref:Exonuclease III n=1 Tax=Tubulinosema ratisbonensis TaxID=291195 RepID=A0A437AJU8_9MICR|nr:exonuclease III [Tubulinosema ratisbonensis]
MKYNINITSFNVNGIRSFEKHVKEKYNKSLNDFFLSTLRSEIICLQETKTNQISDYSSMKDYISFFSVNKKKNGYCGVTTFIKKSFYVNKVIYDEEGRFLLTNHNSFIILNVYFPFFDEKNYKKDLERKREEVIDFYKKIEEIVNKNKCVILLGDFNAVYDFKDHYQYIKEYDKVREINKEIQPIRKENPLPTELPFSFFNEKDLKKYLFSTFQREWLFNFLQRNTHYDSFRKIYQNERKKYTCWNTLLDLRSKNLGTRIDLILIPKEISLINSEILTHVYGSDHCPVTALVEVECNFDEKNLCKKNNNLLSFLKINKI